MLGIKWEAAMGSESKPQPPPTLQYTLPVSKATYTVDCLLFMNIELFLDPILFLSRWFIVFQTIF